jgi:HSP20 family protein
MALMKWRPFESLDPWKTLEDIQEEMNRLFDLSLPKYAREREVGYPAVDISEDENNLYVEADLPGFEQKDIKVSFKNDTLRISASRDEKKEEKKANYHRIERFQGRFERIIPFTKKVEGNKVKAQYKNGVLKITVPKAPEEKAKEITINVE